MTRVTTMTKNEHTAGPWRVQDVPGDGYGKRFAIFSIKGDVLKGDQLRPDGVSIGEARTNARLIAAAPDLLAALEWFVRWHEAVPAKEFIPGPINRGIAIATAALAKVSGP